MELIPDSYFDSRIFYLFMNVNFSMKFELE